MAKPRKIPEKKTSANSKKPKLSTMNTDWDVLPAASEGQDVDSDAGSFMDDDTEDFLPLNWTGDAIKKPLGEEKIKPSTIVEDQRIRSKAAGNASSPAYKSMPDLTTAEHAAQSASLQAQLATVIDTGLVDRISEVKIQCPTTNAEAFTSHENIPVVFATEGTPRTITISRLQVPASHIRQQQPLSEVERLREEVKSLKQEVAKYDRDLKSAKRHAASAHTKAELATKAQLENERTLEEQYKCRYEHLKEEIEELKSERNAAQNELKPVQEEAQKAIGDLRKERSLSEKLKRETKELQEKLRSESAKSSELQVVVDSLSSEMQVKAEAVISWKSKATTSASMCARLEANLTSTRNRLNEASKKISDHISENVALKGQLDTARHTATTWQNNEYRDLRRRYDTLQREFNGEKREMDQLREDVEYHRTERDQLECKLDETKLDLRHAKGDIQKRDRKIMRLEQEMREKIYELHCTGPFCQAAVEVRLRFLEQAREMIFGVPRAEVDVAIIQDGNNAAHRGNGELDSELFDSDFFPEEYRDDAEMIFRELYGCAPSDWDDLSFNMKRLRNCQASLACLRARNNGIVSDEKRDEFAAIVQQIQGYNSWMSDYTFQNNPEVNDLLERLESLTDEIIQLDRAKSRRR